MALVKYNNNSISAITAASSLTAGAMTLIKEQTASSSATISFVNGTSDVVLDSTYPIYVFKFINIHPATDQTFLTFQADTGTNTSYNQTITSTFFAAYHGEDGTGAALAYADSYDQAQATSFQYITDRTGTDNDQTVAGTLHLFDPSSSTFVKHFTAVSNCNEQSNYSSQVFAAGYFNTTTALTRVQFKMSSGNIDAGVIKLYGVS